MKPSAGFLNLKGTLFDSAIMKTSVISPAFTEQYLSNPNDPMAFEGPVAVFDGPEDYHHRIETDKSIHAGTILIIRGAGPVGYPGAAEVVNMIPPGHLIKQGIEVCSLTHVPFCFQLTVSYHVSETVDSPVHPALHPSLTHPQKQQQAVC